MSARLPKSTLLLSNFLGAVPGAADLYSWGLASPSQGLKYLDVRAVGVQSDVEPYLAATDRLLVFAVNMHKRFSALGYSEIDIYIDNNGDGNPEYAIIMFDVAHLTIGVASGQVGTFVYNFATGTYTTEFIADAPTDGSTVLLPVDAADVGVTAANPRFTYSADAYDLDGTFETVPDQPRSMHSHRRSRAA